MRFVISNDVSWAGPQDNTILARFRISTTSMVMPTGNPVPFGFIQNFGSQWTTAMRQAGH